MNYMAVDSDGTVCQYELEPFRNIVTDSWDISEQGDLWDLVGSITLPPDVKWYDTLVERKGETNIPQKDFTLTNDQIDLLINIAERHILSYGLTSITREGILAVIHMYEQLKNK